MNGQGVISRLHDPTARGFASDNSAGVHPDVLAALTVANEGHQTAYGEDVYTAHLQHVFRQHFGDRATAYPVFNGTGANVLGLQAMSAPWGAVVCADSAHIHTDEAGAPEKVAGLKLLTVPTLDGKLTPALIERQAWGWDDEHRAQPNVVSISQSTELGTLYTPEETAAVCAWAHDRGMLVHVDGARLANAAAALGVPLRALTTDAGVDVLSFGGTKNGMLYGEAMVVLNPEAVRSPERLRKSTAQLGSKMRFLSAQFIALLESDLWLRNARHANEMAQLLADEVRDLPGVDIVRPVQANAVFAVLPPEVTARLQKRFRFYLRDQSSGEVRWMCAYDTTEGDVRAFAAAIAEELA
ncbi:low specificity L-threonine aldolase [Streptomyces actinomycinicus]|uniref:Low specificity L-threonine aldolase n=1 Tax=Streptomyces actinomycinicus TaxID=1695166 RepID=A0A937EJA4_9ACTN|nr:low specificity L-threonine aldolase [Streptomyces actinomycinicus]MBL1083513.1 low specificity L-threonine aldolase [Streptomyces actinomycinicus]